ncbi:hypothetical protein [Candidatus Regiella insecticola]|uniref:hypothetical protein n=1 Tax=Candidatus Regiella insecticola TaxID=138073 RepID=UPI0002FB90AB|nr:hypothetical protein [Candidatus Regiella insecticola]
MYGDDQELDRVVILSIKHQKNQATSNVAIQKVVSISADQFCCRDDTPLKQPFNQTQSLRTATGYGTGDLVPALTSPQVPCPKTSPLSTTPFF